MSMLYKATSSVLYKMLKSTERIKICRLNKSGREYLVIYETQLRVKWGEGCKNVNVYPLNHGNCSSFSPGGSRLRSTASRNYQWSHLKPVNEIRTRPDGSPTRSLKLTRACRGQKPRPPLPCHLSRCVYFSHTAIYNVAKCVSGDKIMS